MTAKKTKAYIQFSKKMVVFVNIAVTVITVLAMIFCFIMESMTVIQHIVEAYIGFATVCFAAYSGNSAIEKWLIKRYKETEDNSEDEETITKG